MHQNARLFEIIKNKSFKFGDFTLSSGLKSKYYLDIKATSLDPEGALLIGEAFAYRILEEYGKNVSSIKAVGGLTLGADPLVTATSIASFKMGYRLQALIVRKQAKEHGTSQIVEGAGALNPHDEVIVLEDVTTTGKSSLEAALKLREAGFKVGHVLTVVDREQGGEDLLKQHQLTLGCIFKSNQFIN